MAIIMRYFFPLGFVCSLYFFACTVPVPTKSVDEKPVLGETETDCVTIELAPPAKNIKNYEAEFDYCMKLHQKEWVVMYIDTNFANPKYINHPDSGMREILGKDDYSEYKVYKPFCFECVPIYKELMTAHPKSTYVRYRIGREIATDLECFSSQWYTAVSQMLHNYKVFDGDYWARSSDRNKEFNTFMAHMNTLSRNVVLPCGEDTVKHLRFNTFYPSLRAIKGEWYDRSDLLADLKRSTPHLNRFCAGWKRYIDTLTYHFPKHKAAELYHCRCIKRDTLLSKCQIDSLLEHPNNLDFTQ